ncbi:MAG: HAD-IC family P-type ATPase, partial [Gemmatimonadetes bacterium]|nr:HAD-IC family P-type ATPase [Gemmatimonadota bacterium]
YAPSGTLRPVRGTECDQVQTGRRDELLTAGVLASDATLEQADGTWRVVGDPTEGALVVAARKAGLDPAALRAAWPRLDAIPFESERRFMATLHARPDGTGTSAFLKGAPEAVLARCAPSTGVEAAQVHDWVDELAHRGMRVLAIAVRDGDAGDTSLDEAHLHGFRLLGLAGMIDPPRPEAIAAIRRCHEAGTVVKMITGDHRATAVAVARQLNLVKEGAQGVNGADLEHMGEAALAEAADRENVFARVAPEHKLALVRALQGRGHVVAMTGDGVNDSPALKQADIGVAMGITGTDASKEASDIVLADDNFATIAAAVEEGRRVYDNLLKSLAFVLPTNLGLALILLAAVTAFPIVDGFPVLPMTPTQTLWINLVAAVALALPLAFEAMEPDVMRRPPRAPSKPILGGFVLFRTILVAVIMTAGAVGLFLYEYGLETASGVPAQVALGEAQTMAVTTVVLFQVFYLLNCRSLRDTIFRIGLFTNPYVYLGIAVLLLLQLAFVYTPFMNAVIGTLPLNGGALAKSLLVSLTVLPVITLEKALLRRWER